VDLKVQLPTQVIAPQVEITIPIAPPVIHVAPPRRAPPVVVHIAPVRVIPAKVTYAPDVQDYYPDASRRNNEEGRVLVHMCLDTRGRVGATNVAATSGHPALDAAALKLAQAYRFKPATQGGKPVPTCLALPVRFQLTGG
jgi:protein TonB